MIYLLQSMDTAFVNYANSEIWIGTYYWKLASVEMPTFLVLSISDPD